MIRRTIRDGKIIIYEWVCCEYENIVDREKNRFLRLFSQFLVSGIDSAKAFHVLFIEGIHFCYTNQKLYLNVDLYLNLDASGIKSKEF